MYSFDQLQAWLGHDRISRDGVSSAGFDAPTQKNDVLGRLDALPGSGENREASPVAA